MEVVVVVCVCARARTATLERAAYKVISLAFSPPSTPIPHSQPQSANPSSPLCKNRAEQTSERAREPRVQIDPAKQGDDRLHRIPSPISGNRTRLIGIPFSSLPAGGFGFPCFFFARVLAEKKERTERCIFFRLILKEISCFASRYVVEYAHAIVLTEILLSLVGS